MSHRDTSIVAPHSYTIPPPTDEESRRQLAKLCGELLTRIFDPATDVRTATEQLRQGAELVLSQLNQ